MEYKKILLALSLSAMVTFSGCNDSDDSSNSDDMMMNSSSEMSSSSSSMAAASYTYSIQVTNLTAQQPLSPILVTTNSIYAIGEAASEGLELLAEGGDNSMLLDENGVSTDAPVGPGASATLELTTSMQKISIASMLVNTNDAFAGMSGVDLSSLEMNASTNFYLNAFDAGTEANSEKATTIPGPAGGGEGFNEARDDNNIVTSHSGVISKDDGFTTSDLHSIHTFDNPTAIVVVTRTK